ASAAARSVAADVKSAGVQQIINSVDVTCGLSLGEYTALAFAGAFSFEDGLNLVKLKGEASIIGLDSEKVHKLCDAANEEVDEANKVQTANFLCPLSFMNPVVSKLEVALGATEITTPRISVISNVDVQPYADPDTIKKILARQADLQIYQYKMLNLWNSIIAV
ncbi:hypothetical protein A4A49_58898, partial [Nicotiana attenuata]